MRFSIKNFLILLAVSVIPSYCSYEFGYTKGLVDMASHVERPMMMCLKLIGGRITKNGKEAE